ncbi:MAG: Ig-like domain-containing protein [Ruminococcus sp.]
MDLNFSKKTRKIVASLLAVAILLGVLPVSGLTGNSSGAEGNNGSANTIFVKSYHQPVLFDSNGNVKSVLTKKDGTYTGTNVNSSDQIVFLRNDVAKEITVGNTIVFYKKSSNTSTTDDAEPYDRIHVWKENGESYKEWKSDDAIMKKYSGNLYYYIYPSDKNKVIFHNGLNDDEVGVKKSKEWDLNEWQVYTKNGLAGSLLNTLPTCKVGDNNAFSYYSGKITSEKIEKSDKFGATVTDVAGNESDVFKNDKITFYKFLTSKENSEALIDNVKVNDVDGFKGVVTAKKLKEDCTEVEYTYTYTDNTYGIKFTDTKTVNYTFETPLSVSGKWNVKVNDKEVTANDKLYYKDEASFNKITVSFDNAKVTYGGKEISGATNDSATEDGSLKSEYFLNDKEVSSDSLNIQTDSNKSEDENILKVKYSYTVNGKTYETFETFTFYCYVDSTAPEITSFEFATVESDVDKVLSFLTFGIYNNDQVVVTVNAKDEKISSGIKEISLYNGEDEITADDNDYTYENGVFSQTFTLACGENEFNQYMLTAKAWDNVHNVSASYTFEKPDKAEDLYSKGLKAKQSDSADTEVVTNTIAPIVTEIKSNAYGDNSVKYTDSENREWYSNNIQFNISADDSEVANRHTGIKSVTATFNGTDVSEKLKGLPVFTAEKVESVNDITFNTEGLNLNEGTNTVEVTVVNNSGMSSTKKYEVYVDTIKPEVSQFEFKTVKSDVDKILSFLTFGIYNNEKIQVTVSAYDVNNAENAKSGIDYLEENHAEIQLYNGGEKIAADDNSYSYDENGVLSRTFTLDCGETEFKQYMLTAKAWDNVHNMSASYTFEKTDKAEDLYSKGLKAKQSDSADTEVVTNTIAPIVTEIKSNAYGDNSVKYTDSENREWYSNNIQFNISADDSEVANRHTGIKSVTATFNGTDVSEKLKGLPVFTAEKVESVNDITFNTEGLNLNEGTNTVEVTVVNNSGMSSTKKYEVYVDTIKPEVSQFEFKTVKSDVDKILSFLTFGIYNNEKIQVTVSAYDVNNAENAKSGIDYLEENHAEIQLYNGGEKIAADDNSYSYDENGVLSRTFTLDCGETEFKQYMLTAKAWDNVHNMSASYTFEKTDKAEDLYSKGLKAKQSDSADTEVVTNTIAPIVTEIKSNAYGDNSVKYTDSENREWYSNNIQFNISADDSEVANRHTGIKSVTATFNGTDVSEKLKGLPVFTAEKVESVNDITFNTEGLNLNEGTNTVEVTVVNNSGMSSTKKYEVYVDTIKPEVSQFEFKTVKSDVDKILSFLTFGIYNNEKIQVTVSAYDVNNAENAKSGIDYLEENHAEIQLYSVANQDKITAGDYNYKDGILSRTFTLDCRENEFKQYMLTAKAWDNVHNVSASYTFEKPDKAEDLYSKGLKAKQSDSADTEVVTNTIAPIVTEIKSNAYGDNSVKYTDSENREWYSNNIQFNISADDSEVANRHTGIKSVTATFNGTDVSEKLKGLPVFTAEKVESVNDITFNTEGLNLNEGTNTVEVTVVNNSGMSSTKEYKVYVDKIAPEITSFDIQNNDKQKIVDLTSEKQHYNYYFQTDTQVTVNADDNAEDKGNYSGIKTIYFRAYDVVTGEEYKSSKNVSTDNATASATFTVKANFKGELYAYAVDNVDNNGKTQHGEKKPDDLIVETQQHHNGNASVTMSRAKASYKDNSGLDLYSGNVNARVVFEDAYAGIKDAEIKVSDYTNTVTNTISVSVDNNGNITSSGNGSVTVTGTKAKNTNDNLITNIVVDYVVTDNSNNIKITTSMTDRAGNKTDNVKDSLSIDKTKPVIDVKYDNNEHTTYGGNDYYKADRTATVTVTERNFDESLVEAAIMRNGGRYTTIGGWTHNNNTADPDKSTHVAKIVYNTDGDFTFDIAVKDKAMNFADKFTQQKFTVDKTAPVIDVSFDNNSAKNGNYYKADRTATIKITEHNFNSGSQYVNIPVTAEGATAPSVVGWSGSGDDHNATVSFNKDGKYSFTVDYTDLAGNKAVQKKVDSFYIDKTAPEVEITGVADHQAYNGTVAPVVTYRDDNFTDDHDFRFTKIDINGKSDDTSKFDYDTGGNGVTEFIYKYRDFAEVLENDGIYNFTVELSDKAGNSTSKSVTFSVNRFGSTFRTTDEPTEKLINNGYTNAEQDIVVEEINVTPLTKHSVTLAKSGGNSTELVENTDYTFTSSNNGNEWCKSVYTVNKKNFSDEAAYTVTIMSVDKAKNTNNNRMADSSLSTEQKNKRECAISFVVDKTSPLVSITGIKDNELYKEASKKVKIVCEDDNLDKSKLVVTLDNKKLAEGEDYTIVDDKDGSIAGMLTAEIVLKAETGGIKENLKVTIGDLAGNTGEKSVDNFILSANIFQRFFANPVLVICTFAGLALVIAAVIFFVAKKRKKAE